MRSRSCVAACMSELKAYDQYKLHRQQQKLTDEQQMTAQTYSDAAWNWGAWCPSGGAVRVCVRPRGWLVGEFIEL